MGMMLHRTLNELEMREQKILPETETPAPAVQPETKEPEPEPQKRKPGRKRITK